jgi:sucrose-phosphate synthase
MQTLILGNRDDIEDMAGGGGAVLTAVLKLIDRYDLYGQVAYPKHHKQTDVPHIYRLAAKTKVLQNLNIPSYASVFPYSSA